MKRNKLLVWKMIVICAALLATCSISFSSEYPWENGRENETPGKTDGSPLAEKKVYGRFGPFLVEKMEHWGISDGGELGYALTLVNDWEMPQAAITLLDAVREIDDLKKYEKRVIDLVNHNKVSSIFMCGRQTLVLRDFSDGQTVFYLLPSKGTTVYAITVIYFKEQEDITNEVRQMLATFRIDE